jgi:hypothetical protein
MTEEVMPEEPEEELLEPPNLTWPPEFHQALGEWLAAWANGQVTDQSTAYLDRIVKEKVAVKLAKRPRLPAAPPPNARPAPPPDFIIRKFLEAYAGGEHNKLDSELVEYMEETFRLKAGLAPVGGEDQLKEAFDELSERYAKIEQDYLKLRTENSRVHNWRFHLEARARQAHDFVDHYLHVVKRAPTAQEMEEILDVLQEGISWAP